MPNDAAQCRLREKLSHLTHSIICSTDGVPCRPKTILCFPSLALSDRSYSGYRQKVQTCLMGNYFRSADFHEDLSLLQKLICPAEAQDLSEKVTIWPKYLFFSLSLFCLETALLSSLASLKLTAILLPQPSRCSDRRCEPPYLILFLQVLWDLIHTLLPVGNMRRLAGPHPPCSLEAQLPAFSPPCPVTSLLHRSACYPTYKSRDRGHAQGAGTGLGMHLMLFQYLVSC